MSREGRLSANSRLTPTASALSIDGYRVRGIVRTGAATHVIGVGSVERWHYNGDAVIRLCKICIVKPVFRAGYRRKREDISCNLKKRATAVRNACKANLAIVACREIRDADGLARGIGGPLSLVCGSRRRHTSFFTRARFCLLGFASWTLLHLLHGTSGCSSGCLFRSTA